MSTYGPILCSSESIYFSYFFFTYLLQIVKEKDRFRKAPPNYAMKKTQLLKDKVKRRVEIEKKNKELSFFFFYIQMHACI